MLSNKPAEVISDRVSRLNNSQLHPNFRLVSFASGSSFVEKCGPMNVLLDRWNSTLEKTFLLLSFPSMPRMLETRPCQVSA
jgi:hypothetical protein